MGYTRPISTSGIEYILNETETTQGAMLRIKTDVQDFYRTQYDGVMFEQFGDNEVVGIRIKTPSSYNLRGYNSKGVIKIKLRKRSTAREDVDYPAAAWASYDTSIQAYIWFNTFPKDQRQQQRDRFLDSVQGL